MHTPLYPIHKKLGAKFIPFAGWNMPVEYSSIKEEVWAVRNACGLFDISHMGRLLIKKGIQSLDYLTSRRIDKVKPFRVQYNLLMNEKGGVKDDITLYKLSEEEVFICVNSANKDKVYKWLVEKGIQVEDISGRTLQIALQGPKAVELLKKYYPIEDLKYYHFGVFDGTIISRTGYTGEDGFEIYVEVSKGLKLFEQLLKDCIPCGLGARDVLRIEAGMPLYGHELSEDITPFEANLDRYVDLEKDFIGRDGLLKRPVKFKLFGVELLQRGVPREGYHIFYKDKKIGYVSSGTFSPILQKGIGLCFMDIEYREENLSVEIDIRGKRVPAKLRSYPFVKGL
ncbi:MAG: glycine cleavage system aminomethyltransferase GcvT [Aquificaceae bacterium]